VKLKWENKKATVQSLFQTSQDLNLIIE